MTPMAAGTSQKLIAARRRALARRSRRLKITCYSKRCSTHYSSREPAHERTSAVLWEQLLERETRVWGAHARRLRGVRGEPWT
jgi:hypothetical protein